MSEERDSSNPNEAHFVESPESLGSERESARPAQATPVEASGDVEATDLGGCVDGEAEPSPVAALEAQVKQVRDQLLRTAADFDNFRKRSRRDQADNERRAKEGLLRELLPVFDNLERAVAHAGAASDTKALSEGIQMVLRLFADTLERLAIERVATVGTPFDPTLHEAIQHELTSSVPTGTVTAEVQAGYRMAGSLIRPAMVVVAKAPPEA